MELEIRRARPDDIEEFISWRYEAPYDVYDITDDPASAVAYFTSDDVMCHVLVSDGEVVGFCTLGNDARVPGGDYGLDALDVGLGLRPDLTGRGVSREVLPRVVAHAVETGESQTLRVTIAAANARAIAAWRRQGFAEVGRFNADRPVLGSDDFVILVR